MKRSNATLTDRFVQLVPEGIRLKRQTSLFLVLALATLTLFSLPVGAQTVTGSLVGHVEDQSGAVIVGARVVATDIERGTSRETVTNDEGNYTISSMEPGNYRVEVERQGFGTFTVKSTEVAINTTVRVDAKLQAGGVAETVEVSGEPTLLKTDRGDISQQITQEQVENLPLSPDRNFQSVVELVPGNDEVTPPAGSAFGNPGGSVANHVNGQNSRYNSYQLDGTINNQTNVTSLLAIVPPAEAIKVVDVSTSAYDAEQGRTTGAIVNVEIKSGTNDFRGSAFAYNTNSAFNARNALRNLDKPKTNLNQFGFTFGGPIIRNRTFFFGNYQGTRNRRGVNALLSVPTAEFRNGDLSASTTPIFDPSTGTSSGANRTQFRFNGVNNVIPPNRISPVARNVLNLLPLPNRPGLFGNYEVSGTNVLDRDAFDVKINHNFSERTQGFVRYSFFYADVAEPPVFGVLGGPTAGNSATAAIGTSKNQSASINLTHTFSPNLVTEFRLGAVRVLFQGASPTEPDIATQLGFPGITENFFSAGIPSLVFNTFTGLGITATLPFKIAETSTNFVNNWTRIKGNHTFRFGADIRNLILNPLQSVGNPRGNPRGTLTFGSNITGINRSGNRTSFANSFAGFLLGLPSAVERVTINQEGGYRLRQYFFFAQDRWQVRPNLTVNYGLRYEIYPFATVPNPGDQARYDPETDQLFVAGYGDVDKRTNVKTDYTNFAPRFGIAYRPTQKTVFRGGYGISYAPLPINQLNTGNYPAQVRVSIPGPNSFTPVGSVTTPIPDTPVVDVSSGVITPPNIILNAVNPNARRGYVQSYNASVQREIYKFVIEAGYVGSMSTRLPILQNINAVAPRADRPVTTSDRPLAQRYGRTVDVLYADFRASANYNALQTRIERRFRQGSRLSVAYTWSKALDYANIFDLENDLDINANYGPSGFDRTHMFVAGHVIRLPFGRRQRFFNKGGIASAIFGGFTLSGTFSARTGQPISITGTRTANTSPIGFTNRPDVIGTPAILGGAGPGQPYFDTSAFQDPAPGTIGNAGRNIVRGPGFVSYNASLSRTFTLPFEAIKERVRLQLRADAFNVTNSPQYRNPEGSVTDAQFGEITTSYNERQVRFGLRVTF
ncbi:MAG: TonB-dependent receptor [Chthoniobacterales bacterium]|nr:TonB-dependent receptor [Chthoniobacterales bacterium]